jgi:hypothetical protein
MASYDACLQDAHQCVSLDHNWPKGYFRLGVAFQHLEQPEEALMAFELGLSFLSTTTAEVQGGGERGGDCKLAKEFKERIAGLQKTPLSSHVAVTATETETAASIAITLECDGEGGEGGAANVYIKAISPGETCTAMI